MANMFRNHLKSGQNPTQIESIPGPVLHRALGDQQPAPLGLRRPDVVDAEDAGDEEDEDVHGDEHGEGAEGGVQVLVLRDLALDHLGCNSVVS